MNGSNDWKGSIWHHKQVEFGVSQSRLPQVIPTPWRTEHLCGITIKGRWERDALRPGIRLFLESHPQKVADLGSDFGLVILQNTLA